MANFKRRKCRRNAVHAKRGSDASWRAKHGFKPARVRRDDFENWDTWKLQWVHPEGKSYLSQMNGNPAWWDRTFHTKPKRAATRRLEQQILRDAVDPDDTAWPLASNRPTNYYW